MDKDNAFVAQDLLYANAIVVSVVKRVIEVSKSLKYVIPKLRQNDFTAGFSAVTSWG